MPATFNLRSQGVVLGNPYSVRSSWKNIGFFNLADGFFPTFISYSPDLDQYLMSSSNSINIYISDDNLLTWTGIDPSIQLGMGGTQKWRDAAWSPTLGLWAMTCATLGASAIATSPDGTTWTKRTATDGFFQGIHWSPEIAKFVCCSQLGGIFTSVDGITWTQFAQALANEFQDLAYSPSLDRWVAVSGTGGESGQRVIQKTGNPSVINWPRAVTPLLGGVNPNWNHVRWSPEDNLFVAGCVGDVTVGCTMTSPDGITWTLRQFAIPTNSQGLDYSPALHRWVIGASTGAPLQRRVRTSENGIDWFSFRKTAPGSIGGVVAVLWNPTKNIFVANNRGTNATPTQRIQISKTGK